MTEFFHRFARASAFALGTPQGFMVLWAVVVVWHVVWWILGWSERWVDKGLLYLSIVTQATGQLVHYHEQQTKRIEQAKTDELIRANPDARNTLLGLQDLSREELERELERRERENQRLREECQDG